MLRHRKQYHLHCIPERCYSRCEDEASHVWFQGMLGRLKCPESAWITPWFPVGGGVTGAAHLINSTIISHDACLSELQHVLWHSANKALRPQGQEQPTAAESQQLQLNKEQQKKCFVP